MGEEVAGVGTLAGASVIDSFINTLARIGVSILRGVIDIVRRPSVLYAILTVLPGIIRQFSNFIQQVGIDVSEFAQSILQFANYIFNVVYNYIVSKLPQPSGAFSWLAPIVDALAIVPAGILALPFYIAGYIVEYVVAPIVQFFVSIELIVLNGVYTFLCKYVTPLLGYFFSVYLGYEAFKYFATRGRLPTAILGGLLGGVGGLVMNTELQALLSIIGMGCQQQLVSMPPITVTVTQLPSTLVELAYTVGLAYSYTSTVGGLVQNTYADTLKYSLTYGCLNCIQSSYTDAVGYSLSIQLPKGAYYTYQDSLTYSLTAKYIPPSSLSGQQAISIPIEVSYNLFVSTVCESLFVTNYYYTICTENSYSSDSGTSNTPVTSGCSVTSDSTGTSYYISCAENNPASDTGSG
ncbi:MAG: hypothetical protein RXR18_05645 [Nitrososphaeria archaeon]